MYGIHVLETVWPTIPGLKNPSLMSIEDGPTSLEFPEDLFFIDTAGKNSEAFINDSEPGFTKNESVWYDEDDEQAKVSLVHDTKLRKLRVDEEEKVVSAKDYASRLRKYHSEKFLNTLKWAETARVNADASVEDLYGQESYEPSSLDRAVDSSAVSDVLLPDFLAINRKTSFKVPSNSTNFLESLEFHPRINNLVHASGMDKSLHLFKIDGTFSNKVFSAKFQDMPVVSSRFSADGSEIIALGRRPFFYNFDLESQKVIRSNGVKGRHETEWSGPCYSACGKYLFLCGADGNIVVLSAKNKQWLTNLKMNEGVKALCASIDSRYLFSIGSASGVYIWDLISFKCVKRFTDDGGLSGLSIAVSSDMSLLACGSISGIVNVYDLQAILSASSFTLAPTALRSYGNLVNPLSGITFHPSSQLLCFFSREKRNAVRFVHFPSGRVYSNWPTEQSPLGRIVASGYNSRGDSVAFANRNGAVQIYNLKHFSQALSD